MCFFGLIFARRIGAKRVKNRPPGLDLELLVADVGSGYSCFTRKCPQTSNWCLLNPFPNTFFSRKSRANKEAKHLFYTGRPFNRFHVTEIF